MKTYPKIGDKLYLRQYTGNYMVDMVKTPYTVVGIQGGKVLVQACKLIAPVYHCTGNPMMDRPDLEGQRVFFYNTVAEKIEEDPNGEIVTLSWAPKKERWQIDKYHTGYPEVAIFGSWVHQPYLD